MIIKNQKGSCLILIIIITTFLSILLYLAWYKNSLLYDLVICRQSFYKNFYKTECALNYGLRYAKDNYDYFLSKDTLNKLPVKISLNNLKQCLNLGQNDFLYIFINRAKNKLKYEQQLWLTATLQKNKKIICKLSCKLKRELIEKGQGVQTQFTVQNFTIGDSF